MTSCENMDKVLEAMGAGQCTITMVLKAEMILSLQEDVDYYWWVRQEYRFKGKNNPNNPYKNSFRVNVHKMTSNKFWPNGDKPESLDDWDQR